MKTLVSQEEAAQKATEVGELLTAMIQLGGIYFVDDMGFVRSRSNPEEAVPVEIEGVVKKLMIYKEDIKDPETVVVLNPFSEGQSTSQEKTWFFCTCSIVFSNVVKMVIKNVIEKGVAIKDTTVASAEDPAFITLLSPYVEEVDAKMLNEVDMIMGSSPTSFITIYYHARTKTAHLKIGLKEAEFKDAFPKVRKKTWSFLEKIITNIFGMNPSYHDYTSNLIGCPHFDAYVHVWHRVYKSLNMFLPFIGINFDEAKFSSYIEGDKIEDYHKHTRWLAQPSLNSKTIIGGTTGKTMVSSTAATTNNKTPTPMPWMVNNANAGEPVWKQMASMMQMQRQQQQMLLASVGGAMPGMGMPMGMGVQMPMMQGNMMYQQQMPVNMMGMPMMNTGMMDPMAEKRMRLNVPGQPGL